MIQALNIFGHPPLYISPNTKAQRDTHHSVAALQTQMPLNVIVRQCQKTTLENGGQKLKAKLDCIVIWPKVNSEWAKYLFTVGGGDEKQRVRRHLANEKGDKRNGKKSKLVAPVR